MQSELAALYLLAENESAYRDLCAGMIRKQELIGNEVAAQLAARACALRPGAVSDLEAPIRFAESAVALAPHAWHHYALGAAQYRAGQHAAAIQTLEKSLEIHPAWIGRGQTFLYLAMACHALDRDSAAHDWLAKADESMQELEHLRDTWRFGFANSDYTIDWLSVLVLLPEAKAMLALSEKSAPSTH
jgi:tetratricopeptide (TPR) repeat protein